MSSVTGVFPAAYSDSTAEWCTQSKCYNILSLNPPIYLLSFIVYILSFYLSSGAFKMYPQCDISRVLLWLKHNKKCKLWISEEFLSWLLKKNLQCRLKSIWHDSGRNIHRGGNVSFTRCLVTFGDFLPFTSVFLWQQQAFNYNHRMWSCASVHQWSCSSHPFLFRL